MKKGIGLYGACLIALASESGAQLLYENNPGANSIVRARNNGITAHDGYAVYGENKPQANYGIGVRGDAGYIGVQGTATFSGTGFRYGGRFTGSNGFYTNYGVYGEALGGSTAYGVYGYAGGASTNVAGYFEGNVVVTGTFSNPSDERLKKDVKPLAGALDKLLALRASSYLYDDANLPVRGLPKGRQYGLLAGDVEALFPELVQEIPLASDPAADDKQALQAPPRTYLSVNYVGLIPVLIAAIKEQQAEIRSLKAALKK